MQFVMRSLISIKDLSSSEILHLLKSAEKMKAKAPGHLLSGKCLASCFYEPSTRTRLSFETAMLRLGGNVVGFSEAKATSGAKGESLHDAMKVIGSYADVIALRHPADGAARLAQMATQTPLINAGDGTNEHPTQTLIDLFSIKECQGKLKGLSIAFVGDLKHGRTVHSLTTACAHFDMRLFFVAPESLCLPEEICQTLKKQGIKFSFHRTLSEVVSKIDILYVTRLQRERLDEKSALEHAGAWIITPELLRGLKKNFKILHPLPRVDEIDPAVDATPYAYYFQQAANGISVRQAILAFALGRL